MMDLNEVLNRIRKAEKEAEIEIKLVRIAEDFGESKALRDPMVIRLSHISETICEIVPHINRQIVTMLLYHYYNDHDLHLIPEYSGLCEQDIQTLYTIANVIACYQLDKNLI